MTPFPPIVDSGVSLVPDPSRVVTRVFVPGREDLGPGDSRAGQVIDRILALEDAAVDTAVADLDRRFAHRHRALHETFEAHAELVTMRLDPSVDVGPQRRLLIGAAFTHEYSIEAAALCNPSMVLHPDQDDTGSVRFVLSVRCVGEGHRSSIGFRTGRIGADGTVSIDAPGPFPAIGVTTPGLNRRSVFHALLGQVDDDRDNAAYVLDPLPERFDDHALEARLDELDADRATRRRTGETMGRLRRMARSSYDVGFPDAGDLSERVLWPAAPAESHGMEDARFIRFVDGADPPVYYATYTAYDGSDISIQLLETSDFVRFSSTPLAGRSAAGKGLALFPRRIGGRYAALCRSDRETNSVAFSDDRVRWDDGVTIQRPERSWELLQLGNCGSPIETEAGWLVLTHGVGAMRTYSIGAILLDLDDPTQVIAATEEPIITPDGDHRDGYVPNVVYSCGAMAHGDLLVLPYGIGDQRIAIATMSIAALIASMRPTGMPLPS